MHILGNLQYIQKKGIRSVSSKMDFNNYNYAAKKAVEDINTTTQDTRKYKFI